MGNGLSFLLSFRTTTLGVQLCCRAIGYLAALLYGISHWEPMHSELLCFGSLGVMAWRVRRALKARLGPKGLQDPRVREGLQGSTHRHLWMGDHPTPQRRVARLSMRQESAVQEPTISNLPAHRSSRPTAIWRPRREGDGRWSKIVSWESIRRTSGRSLTQRDSRVAVGRVSTPTSMMDACISMERCTWTLSRISGGRPPFSLSRGERGLMPARCVFRTPR
jgi:hypothetical protein